MSNDMKEMVASWHSRLGKQIKACRTARDKIKRAKRPEQAAMLAGKTKAYTEMQNYLESKYQKCMPEITGEQPTDQKAGSKLEWIIERSLDEFYKSTARTAREKVEKLTHRQLGEAVRQAIQCGDFTRYVVRDSDRQHVGYIPFRREQELLAEIERLNTIVANTGYNGDVS